jgi:hypothetical protein
MSYARRAALAVWEFVVGDDWRTAAGVVLALALVALLAGANVAAWWVMPPAVLALLALSVRRESHAARRRALRDSLPR